MTVFSKLTVLSIALFSAEALLSTDAIACPGGAAPCNAGGAANICQFPAPGVWTCDLTRNGNGVAAAATIIYDGAGATCAAAGNLCAWGTDAATGGAFCCEVARGAITNVNLMGGNQPDTLSFHHPASGLDLDGALTGLADGREGDDVIHGSFSVAGTYQDDLRGGSQYDTIYGNDGNDIIAGGSEGDTLLGGAGDDTINGNDGDDTINGEAGYDTCHGDAGNDGVQGGSQDDYVYGDVGSDDVCGGLGNDHLYGGVGDDALWGAGAGDLLDAGTEVTIGDYCDSSGTDTTGECEYTTLTAKPTLCP